MNKLKGLLKMLRKGYKQLFASFPTKSDMGYLGFLAFESPFVHCLIHSSIRGTLVEHLICSRIKRNIYRGTIDQKGYLQGKTPHGCVAIVSYYYGGILERREYWYIQPAGYGNVRLAFRKVGAIVPLSLIGGDYNNLLKSYAQFLTQQINIIHKYN